MEISVVDKSTIKIKGKNSVFLVDPTSSMPKTPGDAVLFLDDSIDIDSELVKTDGVRVVVKGPGSYEVGGSRVSSLRSGDGFFYELNIDGLNVYLTNTKAAEKQQDKGQCSVLILRCDGEFKEAMVSSFEPNTAVLYGANAEQAAKLLGKEHQTVSKFSQTADKLPADPQIVLLK